MRLAERLFNDYCAEKEIQWFAGYAEPGYRDHGKGVLVCNWNHEERAGELAEKLGFATEWFDEWMACDSCYKLLRKEPDNYMWLPAFIALANGQEVVCIECFNRDREHYLIETITEFENQPRKCLPEWIDEAWMEDLGYIKPIIAQYGEEFETGYHQGQNDDPQRVFAILQPRYKSVVFQVTSKGQFDVRWIVWAKETSITEEPEESDDETTMPVVIIHRHRSDSNV